MEAFTEKAWLYLRRWAVASLVFFDGYKSAGKVMQMLGDSYGPPVAMGGVVLSIVIAVSIMKHGL